MIQSVGSFARKDLITVSPFQGTDSVRKLLEEHPALLVSENGKYFGILTHRDLGVKRHLLVIDCLLPKPEVTPDREVIEVLELMKDSGNDVLPLVNGEKFGGVVLRSDLADNLYRNLENQRTVIGMVAHDLKAPLANLSGLINVLKATTEDEDGLELVDYADRACKHAFDILDSLLLSSRLEANGRYELQHAEQTCMNELLLEVVNSFRTLYDQKGVELKARLPKKQYTLTVNRTNIRRALDNLVSNALKYTPAGGHVEVLLKSVPGGVHLLVKDSGIGIPQELLPQLFKKFTKAKRHGTEGEQSVGLGMYITKLMVEQHRGTISVESKEGEGTLFRVMLPA